MQPKFILIVDDEESVRESLDKVLKRAGYVTQTASSGEDALALMAEKAADLVLTDLRMPSSDGISLLKSLKKKYQGTEVIC